MNKKYVITLVLVTFLLLAGIVTGAAANSHGRITGGFYSQNFFIVEQGWFNFNVVEFANGKADGYVHWKESSEMMGGLRWVQSHPICVAFDEYEGSPAATFVVEVDRIRGWRDPAEFEGELMKFWVVDRGEPGNAGDEWSTLGPWPPTDNLDDYGCHYQNPWFTFPVDGGNLMIHE